MMIYDDDDEVYDDDDDDDGDDDDDEPLEHLLPQPAVEVLSPPLASDFQLHSPEILSSDLNSRFTSFKSWLC